VPSAKPTNKLAQLKNDVLARAWLLDPITRAADVIGGQQNDGEADIRVSLKFLDDCTALVRLLM
jgi:hypothetical protein